MDIISNSLVNSQINDIIKIRVVRYAVRWNFMQIMNKYLLYVLCFALIFAKICFGQQANQPLEKTQYISKISYHGNKVIDSKRISEIMGIYPKQKFDSAVIESSIINLLDTYKKLGYMFAKVSWEYVPEKEDKIIVNINIQEGEQVVIGKITFSGNKIFSDKLLIKRLSINKIRYFDESIFEDDINQILRFYSDNGYPMAIISPTVNIENGKINLNIQIDSGKQIKINEIKLNGLKKTKENVVIRELPIQSGEIFNQDKIDETEKLLNNIGYFQNTSQISFSKADDGNLIAVISVTERPTGRLNGLLGYNPSGKEDESKLIGTIDAMESNLLGTARQISLSGKRGSANSYRLMYVEPYIFDLPIDIGLHFQAENQSDNSIGQEIREREAGLSNSIRVGTLDKIFLTGKYKEIKSSSLLENPDFAEDELVNGRKYSLEFGLNIDNRDYIFNPSKGYYTNTGIELSRGDFKLLKAWLDLNICIKSFSQQVLALRFYTGQVWGDDIPTTELFYLGGANTLRGYREEQFRGYKSQFANIEYRFLSGKDSHFFLFLDSGKVYNEGGESNKIKLGYGIGLRLESLNGAINMDYGLAKGDSILKGKIHVSLGAVF